MSMEVESHLLFDIRLTVWQRADEISIRERVEQALNVACDQLSNSPGTLSIGYKIRETTDLS